jgi:hypothetical protein
MWNSLEACHLQLGLRRLLIVCCLSRRPAAAGTHSHPPDIHPRARHSSPRNALRVPVPHSSVRSFSNGRARLTDTPTSNRNLKRALELANVVADSRYKLYEDFAHAEGRRLGDYLEAVRHAVLGALEKGGADPFRVISE